MAAESGEPTPKRAAKCKAKAKAKGAPRQLTEEQRNHDNLMARYRYALERSKRAVRKQHAKATAAERKMWAKKFAATGSFDFVEVLKREDKARVENRRKRGRWMTEDAIYAEEGYTEANKNTPFGIRAAARAKATVDYCKKMGKKYCRRHEQHGDKIFRKLDDTDDTCRTHKQSLETVGTRKVNSEEAEHADDVDSDDDESKNGSDESSSSSNSSGDKNDDDDEDEKASCNEKAKALGSCIALKAKMEDMNDPKKYKWLEPWAPKIQKAVEGLNEASQSLLKVVAGDRDNAMKQKAMECVEESTRLYDVLKPVHETMLAATEKIAQH